MINSPIKAKNAYYSLLLISFFSQSGKSGNFFIRFISCTKIPLIYYKINFRIFVKCLLCISLIIASQPGYSDMSQSNQSTLIPPKAEKTEYKHTIHGDDRVDYYQWLRDDDRKDPKVISYLNQENKYTDSLMSSHKNEIDKIYHEIIGRLPDKEQTVPSKIDNYWYYSRYETGKEYPLYARKKESLEADEEIMIDMNSRAEGKSYFYSNYQSVSPNHKIIGFSEDITGRRQYSLQFKSLHEDKMYSDVIENTTGTIVWASDNKTIFYTKLHPVTLLAYQVYRHTLGSQEKDSLVYEEKDSAFNVSIASSTSRKYIYIQCDSTTSSEVLYLNADTPTDDFKMFLPREKNHEYGIEELNDEFYVMTNWNAKNFRIMKTSLANSNNKQEWNEIVPHNDDVLLYDVIAFRNYLAIEQRENGILSIRLLDYETGDEHFVKSDEEASTMWLDYNPSQDTDILRYDYASMTTPHTIFEYNMKTQERKLLKQDEVIGSYNSDEYETKRLQIVARDGEKIPVSLVYKKQETPLGLRPILIYGYGSYGISEDPTFSYSRISLLDRGFIFALAHIRGSQAKGRRWYEEGKMLNKKNTFNDFIDVTKGLTEKNYGNKSQVFAYGGSAGGLLMGAVVNMEPALYKGVIAAVPFVDVMTTMLDEDIPLTTGEFEEWGNPKDKEYYDYMLSYSPYDNVKAHDYPNMLVTTGFYDSQVQYWEPAKWVAKLRELKTDDNLLLLRTNMEAGHGGASGRYQQYKEVAEEYGFLLKVLGD